MNWNFETCFILFCFIVHKKMSVPTRYFESGPAPAYDGDVISAIKKACPFVFLVCFRDKNKNLMIYQTRVKDGKLLEPPIENYWLILEPSYQEARKKSGIIHDREEPSFLDRNFAWGFEQKRVSDTEATFKFKNNDQSMTVKLSPTGAQLFVAKDARKYLIRSLYIAASEDIKIFDLKKNVKTLFVSGLDITEQPYVMKKVYLVGSDENEQKK